MPKRQRQTERRDDRVDVAGDLRIIGGQFRGSRLSYHGDRTTRPMKERVREAIFNLLGTDVAGKHAIDLFAGTGAIGLEALSRGAASGTFIERHVPTARLVQENIRRLGVADRCELLGTSAFLWVRQVCGRHGTGGVGDFRLQISDFRFELHPQTPAWAVFCSPPYDFYVGRQPEMLELIGGLVEAAPRGSVFVVEADERFDFNLLPTPVGPAGYPLGAAGTNTAVHQSTPTPGRRAPPGAWRIRSYPPAEIAILRLPAEPRTDDA